MVDPRLAGELRADFERRRDLPEEPLPVGVTVVLAGHRSAGKSRLLPHLAAMLGREAVDLDLEIARRAGRPVKDVFVEDPLGFREVEREVFRALPRGSVVAVGGGFLAHSSDVLKGSVVAVVPISFETYVDRLRDDASRPRLRPEVPIDVELREVFFEREELHKAARPLSLVDLLLKAHRGRRPRRVVTLPPGADPWRFTWAARHAGAELLEVRTDLAPPTLDLRLALRGLPLLVAERGKPIPEAWLEAAELIDRPLGSAPAPLLSHHAEAPMKTSAAVALWKGVPKGTLVKHVEPLGSPEDAKRLFETRAALAELHGADCVTVLATGPLSTAFRAVLAVDNALDYLAADPSFMGAPGQRLLADATREWRRSRGDGRTGRLAIIGSGVARSRSPRLHPQPFDRLDLPRDTPLGPLLRALEPHYRGFAVTAPFKKDAAKAVHASRRAVNTLIRTPKGFRAHNTDVMGAKAVLRALGAKAVTVLGDGGATEALREAADELGVSLEVRPMRLGFATPVRGPVVWTWPAGVEAPKGLSFENATVAIIVYGPPARLIAEAVRALGGQPRFLGPRWFIAQAREQLRLWETAT